MLIMIGKFTGGAMGVFHVTAIFHFAIFTIHDELHLVLQGGAQREIGLAVNESLERIAHMLERQAREFAVHLAAGTAQHVIKSADADEIFEVLPADLGIEISAPG